MSMSYLLSYNELHTRSQNERTIIKNALRELHQKRTKNSSVVRLMKRQCKQGKYFMCKRCHETVPFLTAAHVGKTMSSILNEIIDAHPTKGVYYLDKYVQQYHINHVKIAVCCSKCNKELEKDNGWGTHRLRSRYHK